MRKEEGPTVKFRADEGCGGETSITTGLADVHRSVHVSWLPRRLIAPLFSLHVPPAASTGVLVLLHLGSIISLSSRSLSSRDQPCPASSPASMSFSRFSPSAPTSSFPIPLPPNLSLCLRSLLPHTHPSRYTRAALFCPAISALSGMYLSGISRDQCDGLLARCQGPVAAKWRISPLFRRVSSRSFSSISLGNVSLSMNAAAVFFCDELKTAGDRGVKREEFYGLPKKSATDKKV